MDFPYYLINLSKRQILIDPIFDIKKIPFNKSWNTSDNIIFLSSNKKFRFLTEKDIFNIRDIMLNDFKNFTPITLDESNKDNRWNYFLNYFKLSGRESKIPEVTPHDEPKSSNIVIPHIAEKVLKKRLQQCKQFDNICKSKPITGESWCSVPVKYFYKNNKEYCFDTRELFQSILTSVYAIKYHRLYPQWPNNPWTREPFSINELIYIIKKNISIIVTPKTIVDTIHILKYSLKSTNKDQKIPFNIISFYQFLLVSKANDEEHDIIKNFTSYYLNFIDQIQLEFLKAISDLDLNKLKNCIDEYGDINFIFSKKHYIYTTPLQNVINILYFLYTKVKKNDSETKSKKKKLIKMMLFIIHKFPYHINDKFPNGELPIVNIVKLHDFSLLKYLLKHIKNIDINLLDIKDVNSLSYAIADEYELEWIELLLDYGANPFLNINEYGSQISILNDAKKHFQDTYNFIIDYIKKHPNFKYSPENDQTSESESDQTSEPESELNSPSHVPNQTSESESDYESPTNSELDIFEYPTP